MNKLKLLGWSIVTTMTMLSIIGIYIILQIHLPIKIIDVEQPVGVVSDKHATIDGKSYPALYVGDDVVFEFFYEKYKPYHEKTLRLIVCNDGNLVTVSSIDKNIPLGKGHVPKYHSGIQLPRKISVNEICHFEFDVQYEINFLRTVSIPMRSEDFYVMDNLSEVIE